MAQRQGVLHNLGWLTVGQIASQLLNVWALVFLADFLGSHWFGVVQVGVAFMGYALVTAEWGMISLGIREVARLDGVAAVVDYARAHTGLMALQALAVCGLGLWLLPHLPFYAHEPWVYLLYLAAVLPQVFMHHWIAVGVERMTMVSVTKVALSLVYAALVLVLLRPLAPDGGAAAARWVPALFLVAFVASNLVIAGTLRRWFGRFITPRLPARAEARRRWRETAPLGANAVVLRVLLNIDLILLGVLAAPSVAGNYAAASRLIFFLVVAVEVLWAALLPRLARLAHEDPAAFRRSFNLYLGGVLAGLLPVAVGGALVGTELMTLLYGDQFPQAGPVFRVLAVSYSLLAVGTFLGNTLVAADRQRHYFPPLVAGAALAVVGTLLLVPRLGAVGASWGMLVAHTSLAVLLVVINRKTFNAELGRLLAALAVAVAAMALVVVGTQTWPVLPRIAAGGATYLAVAAWPLRRFLGRTRRAPA